MNEAGWASAGLMPSKAETSELPIFMSHGHDDRMVPIEVARNSCNWAISEGSMEHADCPTTRVVAEAAPWQLWATKR